MLLPTSQLLLKYTHEKHSNEFKRREPDLDRNGLYKSLRTRNHFRLRLIDVVLYSTYCTYILQCTYFQRFNIIPMSFVLQLKYNIKFNLIANSWDISFCVPRSTAYDYTQSRDEVNNTCIIIYNIIIIRLLCISPIL